MKGASKIEISRSALNHNIRFLQDFFGEDVKLSAVVKGNAYGHGIEQVIPVAENSGIDHFSVFSAIEARRVKKIIKSGSKIMIMGWMNEYDIKWAICNDIEFFVSNLDIADIAVKISRKIKNPAKIHIELETGMYRTGLEQKDLKILVGLIKNNPGNLIVKGVCTHYAGAESIANHVRIKNQFSAFNRKVKWLNKQGVYPEKKHTACSAAANNYPNTRMDLIRIGILMYGYWPSPETKVRYLTQNNKKNDPLRRILTWKTCVMSVKKVKAGKFIGYGTTFFAEEDKKIVIIPVGYSQGYSRTLSNWGRILIKEQRAPVIGNVNMNMLIADVTTLTEEVKRGDEVILIGRQGDHTISVASFSEMSDLMNYESLSRLPESIEREIVD